jgi:hypothetical protein
VGTTDDLKGMKVRIKGEHTILGNDSMHRLVLIKFDGHSVWIPIEQTTYFEDKVDRVTTAPIDHDKSNKES